MVLTIILVTWFLCGFAGGYIGWRFIDNRVYDMNVLYIVVSGVLGAITILTATLWFVCTKVPDMKFLSFVVFKGKSK